MCGDSIEEVESFPSPCVRTGEHQEVMNRTFAALLIPAPPGELFVCIFDAISRATASGVISEAMGGGVVAHSVQLDLICSSYTSIHSRADIFAQSSPIRSLGISLTFLKRIQLLPIFSLVLQCFGYSFTNQSINEGLA